MVAVIELIIVGFAAATVAGLNRARAARMHWWMQRWMARHRAPTFVFADLAGYTELTEQQGDEAAARVAREFRRTVAALSREHGAWQIKSLGDGAMIWAPSAARAIALAARVVEEVGTRSDLLPVRVGAHTGSAVMYGGDWYGSAVNVAARLAAEARPNEALISWATRSAADEDIAGPLKRHRDLQLRGLPTPIGVWGLEGSARQADPANPAVRGPRTGPVEGQGRRLLPRNGGAPRSGLRPLTRPGADR